MTSVEGTPHGMVVVWGLLGAQPFGGMTWQVLHHLQGLRELGFDVWYVEDSDRAPLHPLGLEPTADATANIDYLSRQLDLFGFGDRWLYRIPGTRDVRGAGDFRDLRRLYRDADVVLNLCGAQNIGPLHDEIRCLVMLQTDPVADQVHIANGSEWLAGQYARHDHLFTYASNIGADDCLIPLCGFEWNVTRPPVVTAWWGGGAHRRDVMTTVASWRQTGQEIEWQGEVYHWRKDREFRRLLSLPSRVPLPLELALQHVSDEEMADLRDHGWAVRRADGLRDPMSYRAYISASLGEFTVAKDQNVRFLSGWFSDRSACYLAAGAPVVMQDTAFDRDLPTGKGLFSFRDREDAVAALDEVAREPRLHATAATELAREYFEARDVLRDVLDAVGLM